LENIVKDFKETLEEKLLLAKLLLHTQEAFEERELLLRHYLGQEDIEQLISEWNPPNDATTVAAKYLHAVCGQNSKSFSINSSRVSQFLLDYHPTNDDISHEID
jgi:hypothetical protein